jgi:hypothetical protein
VNLVNELQVSAEQDDVLTVLRKAKRLASKLGVDDIGQWLQWEQEGYTGSKTLPKYRVVKGRVVFNPNGPIPVGMGMIGRGMMDMPGDPILLEKPVPESMNNVVTLVKGCEEQNLGLYYPLPEQSARHLRQLFDPDFADQMSFFLKLNRDQVEAIPEAVKDRILDWALALERRGVLGDGVTFNDKEKAEAHNITFNINNSQIEQFNNMGQNIRSRK